MRVLALPQALAQPPRGAQLLVRAQLRVVLLFQSLFPLAVPARPLSPPLS